MSDIGAVSYRGGVAVTTSNSAADPGGPFDALQATTAAGLAKIVGIDGNVVTIYLPLGVLVPVACTQVWTSTTTATGIVGLKGVFQVS